MEYYFEHPQWIAITVQYSRLCLTLTGQFHMHNASEDVLMLVRHHGPNQTPAPPLAHTSF